MTLNDFPRLYPFVLLCQHLNTTISGLLLLSKVSVLLHFRESLIVSKTSFHWSYIFLFNWPRQEANTKQLSSKTKGHSQQQEAKSFRRRNAVSELDSFWRVVTGTLRWLAIVHCLLYFLAFDWLRQTGLFFLYWTVFPFVKESPIWNYPNWSSIGQFVKIKG